MADPLKERISLLTMGEAQGKLRPEHKAELDRYRQQGLAKRLPQAPPSAGAGPQGAAGDAGGQLETATARDKARSAMLLIDRLQPQIDRVRKLQQTALGRTGLAGLAEYNPFSGSNQEYDAAAAQLTALARPATRSAGEGAMSDFESKLAVAPLPNRWRRDAYNNEAINSLDRLVSTSRRLYSSQLGLPPVPPRRPVPGALPSGWKVTRKP